MKSKSDSIVAVVTSRKHLCIDSIFVNCAYSPGLDESLESRGMLNHLRPVFYEGYYRPLAPVAPTPLLLDLFLGTRLGI